MCYRQRLWLDIRDVPVRCPYCAKYGETEYPNEKEPPSAGVPVVDCAAMPTKDATINQPQILIGTSAIILACWTSASSLILGDRPPLFLCSSLITCGEIVSV